MLVTLTLMAGPTGVEPFEDGERHGTLVDRAGRTVDRGGERHRWDEALYVVGVSMEEVVVAAAATVRKSGIGGGLEVCRAVIDGLDGIGAGPRACGHRVLCAGARHSRPGR